MEADMHQMQEVMVELECVARGHEGQAWIAASIAAAEHICG
jgi:hypothetical protein